MHRYLYLLIFTLLTFVSCETELPEGIWSKDPTTTVTYQLSINKTTIVAKPEGLSETFSITSDDRWTISSTESWIKVSDTAGAGDKNISVTVEANTGKVARTGTITIKGKSSGEKSIAVSQSGKEYSLNVDKSELSVVAEEVSETFTITSNDDWTVSVSEAWVKVTDATGNGNKTITLTVEANTSKEARTATVTITGKNSESKSTITVSQNGKDYTLSVDKSSISVGSTGSTETLTITSNDSWTASSDASWAVLSETSGSGDVEITVTISLNSTTTERTGTITVKGTNSNISKTISITQSGKSVFDTNGHEYVDLGLPSGLLWATCNVGAEKPEDYGDYFAWGEATAKSIYNWSTYKYCNGSHKTLTKYNYYSSYGTIDNKTVLDLEDDAAYVNWGGSWRMPTCAEQSELIDSINCTWTLTTQNGVNGYKVTSKNNGNVLFLPATGNRYDSNLRSPDDGCYWLSSLYLSSPLSAYSLIFGSNGKAMTISARDSGRSVRPVCASSE